MKRGVLAVAAALSLALVGCGSKTISGDVASVVEQCQDASSETRVEVAGTVWDHDDLFGETAIGDTGTCILAEEGESASDAAMVYCQFESVTQEDLDALKPGVEATITGTFSTEMYSSEKTIWLKDCSISE